MFDNSKKKPRRGEMFIEEDQSSYEPRRGEMSRSFPRTFNVSFAGTFRSYGACPSRRLGSYKHFIPTGLRIAAFLLAIASIQSNPILAQRNSKSTGTQSSGRLSEAKPESVGMSSERL